MYQATTTRSRCFHGPQARYRASRPAALDSAATWTPPCTGLGNNSDLRRETAKVAEDPKGSRIAGWELRTLRVRALRLLERRHPWRHPSS